MICSRQTDRKTKNYYWKLLFGTKNINLLDNSKCTSFFNRYRAFIGYIFYMPSREAFAYTYTLPCQLSFSAYIDKVYRKSLCKHFHKETLKILSISKYFANFHIQASHTTEINKKADTSNSKYNLKFHISNIS